MEVVEEIGDFHLATMLVKFPEKQEYLATL